MPTHRKSRARKSAKRSRRQSRKRTYGQMGFVIRPDGSIKHIVQRKSKRTRSKVSRSVLARRRKLVNCIKRSVKRSIQQFKSGSLKFKNRRVTTMKRAIRVGLDRAYRECGRVRVKRVYRRSRSR